MSVCMRNVIFFSEAYLDKSGQKKHTRMLPLPKCKSIFQSLKVQSNKFKNLIWENNMFFH